MQGRWRVEPMAVDGLIFLSLMRFSLLNVQVIEKHQVLDIKANL